MIRLLGITDVLILLSICIDKISMLTSVVAMYDPILVKHPPFSFIVKTSSRGTFKSIWHCKSNSGKRRW